MPGGEEQHNFSFNFGLGGDEPAQPQADAVPEGEEGEEPLDGEEEEVYYEGEESVGLPAEEVNVTYRQIVSCFHLEQCDNHVITSLTL